LFEIGSGYVVAARKLPTGLLGCAFFLVDVFCLGVKDAFYSELSAADLRSQLENDPAEQDFQEIEPAFARKLIRDAAAYATGFGLSAAKDTAVIEAIFGDVDANACDADFTFGKDGKPLYINGPNDTPQRVRSILRALESNGGNDDFEYFVASGPPL
jgi:hypothetical protein